MCSCGRDLKMGVNVKHYLPDNTHFLFTSWWLRFSGSAHWRQWRSNEQDVARNEGCKEMGNGRRRWYVRCRRTRWEEETCRLAQRIIKGKNAVQKTVNFSIYIERLSYPSYSCSLSYRRRYYYTACCSCSLLRMDWRCSTYKNIKSYMFQNRACKFFGWTHMLYNSDE